MKITNLDKEFDLGRNCSTCAYLLRSGDDEPCSSCAHSKQYVLGYGIGDSHWEPMDPDKRDDVKGEDGCSMITTCNKDTELGRSCCNCVYTDLPQDYEPCVRCVHSMVDRNKKGESLVPNGSR